MDEVEQRHIGPWKLLERINRGGNATVWRAARASSSEEVALKVIEAKKVDREPYQRFIREIDFLREHQDVPGVLPLIDAYLPDAPTKEDRPWLAMPIANPIREALAGRPLADVVAAVASIAGTLWRLQRDFNIGHRDIKPGNLYELDGRWLIGDFGLVSLPDTEGLTERAGRQMGPAHYTAYEVILDPAAADPHPADVYSLGKTLWVLATDQRFPPEGQQPAGTRGFGVGDFRPHARAGALDQEIDLMTQIHPEARPSKEQVARDLAAWLELAEEPPSLDVSQERARLQERIHDALMRQDLQEQRQERAEAAFQRLQELTAPLNDALRELSPRTHFDSPRDEMTERLLGTVLLGGVRQVVHRWHRCTTCTPVEELLPLSLKMSRSLELADDGTLFLNLMVHVGRKVGSPNYNWRSQVMQAAAGSLEAEKMLEEGVRDLTDALHHGIDALIEAFPEARQSVKDLNS